MILFLATMAAALADDNTRLLGPDTPVQAAAGFSAAPTFTSMLPLALAGLILAGGWAWQKRNRGDTLESATVENAGRHSLGGTSILHLVDVEDRSGRVRRLVVATGNQGVTLLADLGNDQEQDREQNAQRYDDRRPQVRFDERRNYEVDPRDAPPVRKEDNRRAGAATADRRAQALSLIDEVVNNSQPAPRRNPNTRGVRA